MGSVTSALAVPILLPLVSGGGMAPADATAVLASAAILLLVMASQAANLRGLWPGTESGIGRIDGPEERR